MPDYKKMDCKLFHAAEQAANLLIAAQRECEELYVRPSDPEQKIAFLPFKGGERTD